MSRSFAGLVLALGLVPASMLQAQTPAALPNREQAFARADALDPNPARLRAEREDYLRTCRAEYEAVVADVASRALQPPALARANLEISQALRYDQYRVDWVWNQAGTAQVPVRKTADRLRADLAAYEKTIPISMGLQIHLDVCMHRVLLRHATQASSQAGGQPPAPQGPPPQIKVVTVDRQGSPCVVIEQGPTRWLGTDRRHIVTSVRLNNACATQQLVEAEIARPRSLFSRGIWSSPSANRKTWRPAPPVKALGFTPVHDMYQVFVMRAGEVAYQEITQTLGSEGEIQGRTMACDHVAGGKERTLFKEPGWGRWRCAQLPPPEEMEDATTYTRETFTAFGQELEDACAKQTAAFLATGQKPSDIGVGPPDISMTTLYRAFGALNSSQAIAGRSEIASRADPAGALMRCAMDVRLQQIRRGTFPSWEVVR